MASGRPSSGKSLADLWPAIAAEWHPSKNGDVSAHDSWPSSGVKRWWLGACGHEWDDTPAHRISGRGCPICSGRRVLAGVNDLATTHPSIAAEWHPTKNGELTPADVGAGSHRKVWWLDHGHEWPAIIDNRVRHGHGCGVCRGFTVQAGVNDLASQFPTVAAEWHPTKNKVAASEIVAGSHDKAWFVCPLGHEFFMQIKHRTLRSPAQNCPTCMNKTILVGFNDLAFTDPAIAAEWHPTKNGDLTPEQVTAGSSKRAWWLCADGHDWQAAVRDRRRFACPTCSATGFSTFEEGWVYLLHHDSWDMQKIGITNRPDRRIEQHGRYGWEVSEMRGPMPGDQARAIEQAGLEALRARGAELGKVAKRQFNGHTESWPMSSLKLTSLRELLEWIRADEDASD